jgi:hypothetical protein
LREVQCVRHAASLDCASAVGPPIMSGARLCVRRVSARIIAPGEAAMQDAL